MGFNSAFKGLNCYL